MPEKLSYPSKREKCVKLLPLLNTSDANGSNGGFDMNWNGMKNLGIRKLQ